MSQQKLLQKGKKAPKLKKAKSLSEIETEKAQTKEPLKETT